MMRKHCKDLQKRRNKTPWHNKHFLQHLRLILYQMKVHNSRGNLK